MWVRKQQYPCQPICLVPKRRQKAICLPSPQIYTYPCQLSPTGAELLFEVFSQCYERGSILATTNLPFDEWTEVSGRNA